MLFVCFEFEFRKRQQAAPGSGLPLRQVSVTLNGYHAEASQGGDAHTHTPVRRRPCDEADKAGTRARVRKLASHPRDEANEATRSRTCITPTRRTSEAATPMNIPARQRRNEAARAATQTRALASIAPTR